MSSRRHKSHKSSKNKSRRLGKKGGGLYAMLGRSAIRTGSSFGSFGAKLVVPIILRGFEPPLTKPQRKTIEKYFKSFVNASNNFIQHNVTKAGTKKAIEIVTHPEVFIKKYVDEASKNAQAMKAQLSNPEERAKLLAIAKAKASIAAASAKDAASKVAQTEQFKNVSNVVSNATKNVTNSEQFKAASAAASSAVKSEQFKAASSAASKAASQVTTAATIALNSENKTKPVDPSQNSKGGSKTIKHRNKGTKKRTVGKSFTRKNIWLY